MRGPDPRLTDVWRTTVFRLTLAYCLLFAIGLAAVLGLVYWQAVSGLNRRTDATVQREVQSLLPSTADVLPSRIRSELDHNISRYSYIALFSAAGVLVTGNIPTLPASARAGSPWSVQATGGLPPLRGISIRTDWGETLVVARDTGPVSEVTDIISHALLWSGGVIAGVGLLLATALSVSPLQRLRRLQSASRLIAAGRLDARMPVAGRHDELDLFAQTVNAMVEEMERLLQEVKGVTDAVAHDLRTPLTHVRASLYRLGQDSACSPHSRSVLERATEDLDDVLARFAALLRISELETAKRRAGFKLVDLNALASTAADLYEPLAEEAGLSFHLRTGVGSPKVEGDEKLLFEALSNLLDNAIKFTPAGGSIVVAIEAGGAGPSLVVSDTGPGVAPEERGAVLQRFYRVKDVRAPGSGLGLSLVAAIARLHRFDLRLEDGEPGLRTVLACWSQVYDEPRP